MSTNRRGFLKGPSTSYQDLSLYRHLGLDGDLARVGPQASFPDRPAFLEAVQRLTADWVSQEVLSPAERYAILRAARSAELD